MNLKFLLKTSENSLILKKIEKSLLNFLTFGIEENFNVKSL